MPTPGRLVGRVIDGWTIGVGDLASWSGRRPSGRRPGGYGYPGHAVIVAGLGGLTT